MYSKKSIAVGVAILVFSAIIMFPNGDIVDTIERTTLKGRQMLYNTITTGVFDVEVGVLSNTEIKGPAENVINANDLLKPSGLTKEQFIKMATTRKLKDFADAVLDAEKKYGVNAVFIAAVMSHEGGLFKDGSMSKKCRELHNCFGFRSGTETINDPAYGRGNWGKFKDINEGVDYCVRKIKENYLTPGGKYYVDGTIESIGNIYAPVSDAASNEGWATKVRAIIASLQKDLGQPQKPEYQVSTTTVGGSKYGTWPLPGYKRISSGYIKRISPITGKEEWHQGIDLPAPSGTPIISASDGVVHSAYKGKSYGNHVVVQTDNLRFYYAHMSSMSVQKGDVVKQGQELGKVGSTGDSTAPHLHFEIREGGKHTNPQKYIKIP